MRQLILLLILCAPLACNSSAHVARDQSAHARERVQPARTIPTVHPTEQTLHVFTCNQRGMCDKRGSFRGDALVETIYLEGEWPYAEVWLSDQSWPQRLRPIRGPSWITGRDGYYLATPFRPAFSITRETRFIVFAAANPDGPIERLVCVVMIK